MSGVVPRFTERAKFSFVGLSVGSGSRARSPASVSGSSVLLAFRGALRVLAMGRDADIIVGESAVAARLF